MSTEPIRRRKLSHEVLDRLLGRLRSGEFPVGSTLPSERELMEHFAVGRPAVREALQALERMGFIAIVHGEGARVQALSAEGVIGQISDAAIHMLSMSGDLLESLKDARMFFETGMVRIAAEHRTAEDLEHLAEALEANRQSIDDQSAFHATDMAFHRAIADASGNPIYSAVSRATLDWLSKFQADLVRNPGAEKSIFAEHRKIFEQIEAQDPDAAAEAMIIHLTRANQNYRLNS